jgi:hypothetical protein
MELSMTVWRASDALCFTPPLDLGAVTVDSRLLTR